MPEQTEQHEKTDTNDSEPPEPSSQGTASNTFLVEVTFDHDISRSPDRGMIVDGVQAALRHRGYLQGQMGVRVTTDDTIRELNQRHLEHDYATDVISFGYHADGRVIDGEMVISIDTAARESATRSVSVDEEICLYAIHGTLHVTGMDDHDPHDRMAMRLAERAVLAKIGVLNVDRFMVDEDADVSESAS
ncbi:MAG: rRNA maturation RNase YbeY [Planctomycetota bacterium]